MERTSFYFEQRVTDAELNETMDKSEQAIWDVVSQILGFGFFASPLATEQTVPDLTINLPELLSYDQLGRRVAIPATQAPYNVNCAVDENAASTAVTTPGNEKYLSVFLEFDRQLTDQRQDGNGTTVWWLHNEWFKVNVVQASEGVITAPPFTPPPPLPSLRTDQLLLCDIRLIFGQTQILNADISHARREDFSLTEFLHGGSHRELGSDPVPNATTGDGGLMSAVDKTKVDGITWTGPGISALLNLIGRAMSPTPSNFTVPGAPGSSFAVTGLMPGGKVGTGDATTVGVVTTPGINYIPMFNTNGDSILNVGVGTEEDKVYGRLTCDVPAAPTVWTLSFFYLDDATGVETAYDIGTHQPGLTGVWYAQEVYPLDSFPTLDEMFSVQSDQVAGEVPDATESIYGKVKLAPDGDTSASLVVQGSDSRLLPSAALSAIRRLSGRQELIFMREDGSVPNPKFRLHQFRGMAHGKYPSGDPDYYFDFDTAHADYPLLLHCSGNPSQAGLISGTPPNDYWGADNTRPIPGATGTQWLYCYLVGRDAALGAPQFMLCFSDNAPSVGPQLDDQSGAGGYDFPSEGWEYWRFIGCILNLSTTNTWDLAQLRKIGNHVTYERARLVEELTVADTGVIQVSLANFVPPSSVRADLGAKVTVAGTNIWMGIRPYSAGALKLQQAAGVPPAVPRFEDWKIRVEQFEGGAGGVAQNNERGWVDLTEDRSIEVREVHGVGISDEVGSIYVHGWEEFTDRVNTAFSW